MAASSGSTIPPAFFERDGEWFLPTAHCRGPWVPTACHAGPPTGLMARASEMAIPNQRLARITVDLTRPIPHAGFRLGVEMRRQGRMVSAARVTLIDADDREVVTARTVHIVQRDHDPHPTADFTPPQLAESTPGPFPIDQVGHDQPCFSGSGVEVRYPPGQDDEPGPTTLWMRTVPLLADEEPSPFQRLCPLADCGNAISKNRPGMQAGAINADLTVAVHRYPVGQWMGSQSESHWQPDGTGMSDSLMSSARSVVRSRPSS